MRTSALKDLLKLYLQLNLKVIQADGAIICAL